MKFVVEVVDRVRKTAPPKRRRVEIDTSFVDGTHPSNQRAAQSDYEHNVKANGQPELEPTADLSDNANAQSHLEDVANIVPGETDADTELAIDELVALAEDMDAELARQHAAQHEAERQRDEAYRELEALRECTQEHAGAEAQDREAAREQLAQLEEAISLARAERLEAETERDQATQSAGELLRELEALKGAMEQRETDLQCEIAQAHERIAGLEAEIAKAHEAQREADAKACEAESQRDEACRELEALKGAVEQRETDFLSEIEQAHERIAGLEAETANVHDAKQEADARACEAALQRDEVCRELEALREDAGQKMSEERQELENARKRLAQLDEVIPLARAERLEAEAERDQATRRADEADRELASERKAAEQRDASARRSSEEAQERIAYLEAEIDRAHEARREAEAKARKTESLSGGSVGQQVETQVRSRTTTGTPSAADQTAKDSQLDRSSSAQSKPLPAAVQNTVAPTDSSRSGNDGDRSQRGASKQTSQSVENAKSATTSKSDKPADPTENTNQAARRERRSEPRSKSRIRATIWCEGMSQAWNCIIRERSKCGAQLEYVQDRYGNMQLEFKPGDQLTLKFETPMEITTTTCVVIWAGENCCGVKFSGQFHNEMKKIGNYSKKKMADKAAVGSDTKSKKAVRILTNAISLGIGSR